MLVIWGLTVYAQPMGEALFDTQKNVSEWHVSISMFKAKFWGNETEWMHFGGDARNVVILQVRKAGSLSGSCQERILGSQRWECQYWEPAGWAQRWKGLRLTTCFSILHISGNLSQYSRNSQFLVHGVEQSPM